MRFNIKKEKKGKRKEKPYTFLEMNLLSPFNLKTKKFHSIFRVDILAPFNCWILTRESRMDLWSIWRLAERLKNYGSSKKIWETFHIYCILQYFLMLQLLIHRFWGSHVSLPQVFKNSLTSCYSKYIPWTSSIRVMWELVWSAKCQVHLKPTEFAF